MIQFPGEVISAYLRQQSDVFTDNDFYLYLKQNGIKTTIDEVHEILHMSDIVFPLIDEQYVTRAGAFLGRWFSFKPSKEEIEKNAFIIGHRCMPFVDPEIAPDSIKVFSNGLEVSSSPVTFSMNLAMDVFALYGEGYIIPYIFNDKSNTKFNISSIQYNMPSEITLTAWSLDQVTHGQKFKYGDRILCRVIDWDKSIVEMTLQKSDMDGLVVSESDILREEWYSYFENGLLESFERHGPSRSIEEQLSFLFLENQEQLCIRSCGSVEEFLSHTTKIGFEAYGVETRIWHSGQNVPYVGKWNKAVIEKDSLMTEMAMLFTPQIIDAYLENHIYESKKKRKTENLEEVIEKIFPQNIRMSPSERRFVMLNIGKRHDILKKNYNNFSDFTIAEIRKRALELFTQVNSLLCSIGCSGIEILEFPQQELVILTQLYSHIVRLLEEVENAFLRTELPVEDVSVSIDGMEETFDEIEGTLKTALEMNRLKGYEILKDRC